jgi:acyl-coenzyme A synthetase/AMP-(fatty) acid ligase
MDVAVVGRADAVRTETVVAVCVVTEAPAAPVEKGAPQQDKEQLRAADQKKLSEELRALCREHLAPYEVPSSIEFVKELPRSPLGKLLKRELRKAPAPSVDSARASAAASNTAGTERASDDDKPGPGSGPVNGKHANGKKSEKPEKEAA